MINLNIIVKTKGTNMYWSRSVCFSLGRCFFLLTINCLFVKKLLETTIPTWGDPTVLL